MAQMPNYGIVAERGQNIANNIQKAFNIIANSSTSAIQEYRNNRSLDYAYKQARRYVTERQEKFGLTDSQADAVMNKLKHRKGEDIDKYEKRIGPTMSNMMVWENYVKEPEYQIDMPNPFMDIQPFLASMDNSVKRKRKKEVGEAVTDVVFGGRKGGLSPGTDISNIQEEMKAQDPSAFQTPEENVTQASTREGATQMIAGRMGAKPVSEQELQQYPAYRSLPSEGDLAKGRQEGLRTQDLEAGIKLKGAQTEATQALAKQRNTSEMIDKLKRSINSKKELNNLKDLNTVARLEIASREMLKDVPKYGLDIYGEPKKSGPINEEWLDMKELVDKIKERRAEVSKVGGTIEEAGIKPSIEASDVAGRIQQDVSQAFPSSDTQSAVAGIMELTAQRINQFALSKGVKVDFARIRDALKQGSTEADIIERIIMAVPSKQIKRGSSPIPIQRSKIGGRVGG